MQSAEFRIYLIAKLTISTVNLPPSKYFLSNRRAHTTFRHSICVVSQHLSSNVSYLDRYPMGRLGPSTCPWSSTKLTFLSHASVSTANFPVDFSRANTGGVTKLPFNVDNSFFSCGLSTSNFVGFPFRNFILSGAEIWAKLGKKKHSKFQSSRKDLSSVIFIRSSGFIFSSFAFGATSSDTGLIK